MKVVLFGATGMVGSGVLLECLESPRVSSVLVVGRSSTGVTHLGPLYPVLRTLFPRHMTTTVNVGLAMIEVGADGYPRLILGPIEINALASVAAARGPSAPISPLDGERSR
ncbi:MAG: hypothetical protein JJD97_06285 [Gemmatimonadaceae bacterium]|nr:hypothetical protein [Gemmatimonadaceae bacterium]